MGRAAHWLFWVSIALTLPGLAWQCLEAYGLTLFGEQMLFFSIVHTSLVLTASVYLAFPVGLIVFLQTTAATFLPSYRKLLPLGRMAAVVGSLFLLIHFSLLASYNVWAHHSASRVLVSIIGIVGAVGAFSALFRIALIRKEAAA